MLQLCKHCSYGKKTYHRVVNHLYIPCMMLWENTAGFKGLVNTIPMLNTYIHNYIYLRVDNYVSYS